MEFKTYDVKQVYRVPLCVCGGDLQEVQSKFNYPTSVPQANFQCVKCKKEIRLSQPDWPTIINVIMKEPEPEKLITK